MSTFFYLILSSFAQFILTYFTSLLLAKQLGPDHFGFMAYYQTIASILQLAALLGMDTIIQRDLIKNTQNQNSVFNEALSTRFTSGLLVTAIGFIFALNQHHGAYNTITALVILSTPLITTLHISESYFKANLDGKSIFKANIIGILTLGIGRLLILKVGCGMLMMAALLVISNTVTAIAYRYALNKRALIISLQPSIKKLIKTISVTWGPFAYGISALACQKIDILFAKKQLSAYAFGDYSASLRLTDVYTFFTAALTSAFLPKLIKSSKRIRHLFKSAVIMIAIMITAGIIQFMFFLKFGSTISNVLFGSKFKHVPDLLPILTISTLFANLTFATSRIQIALNQEKWLPISPIISSLIALAVYSSYKPQSASKFASATILIQAISFATTTAIMLYAITTNRNDNTDQT